MSNVQYKVGDTIIQHPFGCAEAAREVFVERRVSNIKNGRAGFDGVSGVLSVWGYDSEVVRVVSGPARFRGED